MEKKKLNKRLLIIVLIITIYTIFMGVNNNLNKEINYTNLVTGIKNKDIKSIEIYYDNSNVSYKDSDGKVKQVSIPDMNQFLKIVSGEIEKNELQVIKTKQPFWDKTFSIVLPFLPYIILIYFWIRLSANAMRTNRMGGSGEDQTFSFGKSKARKFDKEQKTNVTFDDVAGIEEEKEELYEIVDFLKNPEKYTRMGARIPKGVLLVGRPGTGKTLLAKSVAGEAEVPFFSISGSDFVEMFVGVGASRVRDLFAEAKKEAPSIIFIDEIDAVGRQRGAGLGGGHDEREQTLNQLLVEMDGFGSNEGVIVLAATNRPDILDHALLRAGRFDRQIVVSMPDVKARRQIIDVHAKGKKISKDVDLDIIAKNTVGMSGADLENILNEAALIAAKEGKEEITMRILEEAQVKVSMGPEKKSRTISKKEKKLVSYHEAGHAVVSAFLPTQPKIHEISIVPRGMAGGYTMYKNDEDKSFMSKREMEESIIGLLGGRVAEELIIKDISTGASNDIERATNIATDMVTKYGMSSNIGTIHYGSNSESVFLGRDISERKVLSEKTAAEIDTEVKKIVVDCYTKCLDILSRNEDKLHEVASVLMEKEKIDAKRFYNIMGMNIDQDQEEKEANDISKNLFKYKG